MGTSVGLKQQMLALVLCLLVVCAGWLLLCARVDVRTQYGRIQIVEPHGFALYAAKPVAESNLPSGAGQYSEIAKILDTSDVDYSSLRMLDSPTGKPAVRLCLRPERIAPVLDRACAHEGWRAIFVLNGRVVATLERLDARLVPCATIEFDTQTKAQAVFEALRVLGQHAP